MKFLLPIYAVGVAFLAAVPTSSGGCPEISKTIPTYETKGNRLSNIGSDDMQRQLPAHDDTDH